MWLNNLDVHPKNPTGCLWPIGLTEQNRTMICWLPTYDVWDARQVAKLVASHDFPLLGFAEDDSEKEALLVESRRNMFLSFGGSSKPEIIRCV